MHGALRLGILVLLIAAMLPVVSALSCSVKNGNCGITEKCVFTLYDTADSHISECASGYPYKVCCDTLISNCSVRSSCSGSEDRILPVFSSTDSHYYPLAGNNSVCCIKPAPNYINCSVQHTSCPDGSACLASVNSSAEESHAGACGYYDYNVCCKFIDITPPDITSFLIPPVVERGTVLDFSATILDHSPIDRAVMCNSSAMCYGKAGNYCNMSAGAMGRYSCSYNTAGLEIGSSPFYIVVNDTFGNTNYARMGSRIRTTSLTVDSVSPNTVDLQGTVGIKASYLENSTYLLAGATCNISGDVSGSMAFNGVQYYNTTISPARLEDNSFTVTCSKASYPTRSNSSRFIARDLAIDLDFEYDPLANGQPNFLYSKVKTISKYDKVQGANANKAFFNVTQKTDGSLVSSGDLVWNAMTDRWEANFTPILEDNYTATAYFNATVEGGVIDGSVSMRMNARKGFALSRDIEILPIPVTLGSSALVNILVENRRSKDVVYNITFVGDLAAVSFDGQALPLSRKVFILVPAKSVQSHPLLIKGVELSAQEKEVKLILKETQAPYNSDSLSITYKVLYEREGRKYAPDLNVLALLMLTCAAILVLAGRLGRNVRT